MDIAPLAATMVSQQTANDLNMAVLKTVMDIQKQSVMTLIDTLEAGAPSLPAHLGNSINTTA